MQTIMYFAITFILLIIFLNIAWRFYSLRSSLPCPSWLSRLVEFDNPFAKAHKAHLANIQYLNANIGTGSHAFENNQCDRATLVSVLGEIPNQKQALQEIFGVLKPGGILSAIETMFDPHYQSKSKVIKPAQQVGFEIGKHIGNRIAFTIHLNKPRAEDYV